jgi:hypothetical protein
VSVKRWSVVGEGVMRRLLAFVIVACVLLGVAPAAHASKPEKFDYRSIGLYTSWRERQQLSADEYLRIRWSVYASDSREGHDRRFRASVYRAEYRCEQTAGHDPCHRGSYMFGIERDLADVSFHVDQDLGTASLAGAFRLRQFKHDEVVAVKNVEVSATLVGRGDVYRERYSSKSWDGTCLESWYRAEYRYRRAYADVSVTGDVQSSVERVKQSSIFDYDGSVLRRTCD